MDIEWIYELRSCLRRTLIAGMSLLSSDFKLQRVQAALKQYKETSPFFEKIGHLVEQLLLEEGENREATLMDALTLVDALLCTLGKTAVEEAVKPARVYGCGEMVAPCSLITRIENTLNTPENPGYLFATDACSKMPHLFEDYRLRAAVVKAFGAKERYLASEFFWHARRNADDGWIGLLQKDFCPGGGEEMAFRVNVLAEVAGKQCNDFYLQMLPEADDLVKVELIYALRHCQDNADVLHKLVDTQEGEARKRAIYALARMEDERAESYFKKLYENNPIETLQYLKATTASWACRLVGRELLRLLQICQRKEYGQKGNVFDKAEVALLDALLETLEGKCGPEIYEVYRKAFEVEDIYFPDDEGNSICIWQKKIPMRRAYYTWEAVKVEYQASFAELMAYLMIVTLRLNPCGELRILAKELYENTTMGERKEYYLPAVLTAKFFEKEDITPWLRERICDGEKRKKCWKAIVFAFDDLVYDRKKDSFVLKTEMRDGLTYYSEKTTHPVEGVINDALMDLLIEYADVATDAILTNWVNTTNRETTKKLEVYFYKRALTGPLGGRPYYWSGLRRTGCKSCAGLLEDCARRKKDNSKDYGCYSLAAGMMHPMPGDVESFDEETERVFQLLKDGEVCSENFKERSFRADILKAREFVRLGYKEMGI